MNTKTLIAASLVALLGSTAALAQEAVPASWDQSQLAQTAGGKTRADVKAELLAARAKGELSQPGDVYGTVNQALLAARQAHAHPVLASHTTPLGDKAGG